MRRTWILAVVCLLAGIPSLAEDSSLRVLFIGNSFTYGHNMPEIFAEMARARGKSVEVAMEAPGGVNFEKHWEAGKAAEKIRSGSWDVVVLQNQSFEGVSNPANMFQYGRLLAGEIDKAGARKVFYLTWSYKQEVKWMQVDDARALMGRMLFPEMYERLAQSYTTLARDTGGEVAPAGLAWRYAVERDVDLEFYRSDNSHPTEYGAYLTALVFYGTIFRERPDNMPGSIRVTWERKDGPEPVEIDLNDATRRTLEGIAWRACVDLKR